VNQASYVAANEGTGSGPVGNFAPNGLRTAALDITSDGAHIIDPGCNCGQAVNTNADMTQELKVSTSNFGAESSKGPVVITAVGKSGGQAYHGEGYLYLRRSEMNANDWYGNVNGAPKPSSNYYYPGFQIGGPVPLPWTSFNKNRDKLFFFLATEYYKQSIDNGIYNAVVPTAAMRAGDFSDSAYMANLNGYAVTGLLNAERYPDSKIPESQRTAIGLALMNTYPLPNVTPTAPNSWNFILSTTRKANMLQIRPRVDYSITDNTKLYVTYNRQRDDAISSLDTLWTGNAQSWVSPTVPYPSPLANKSVSDSVTANLTHVFSPTLTNEVLFTYTYLNLPHSFEDRTKVERGSLGIDYKMLFDHPNPDKMIFPQLTGWGDGIANQLNAGFEFNGTVYAKKAMPTIADNVSKVWGTHTSKFGFYWERTMNEQPGNGAVNGQMVFANWGGTSTGNAYADMLVGAMAGYSEQNFDTIPNFRYMPVEFYAQDSWKISRRLTVEYGIRLQHLSPWVDTTGYGFAVWDQTKYSNDPARKNDLTGVLWHKKDSSIPLSGTPTRFLYYNPRVGFAWDIFGNGKTVLRGGYGMYHYHDEQNVQNGAYGITQGSFSTGLGAMSSWDQIGQSSAGSWTAPGGITTLDINDDQQPRTQSYSFTVAQRVPWNSVLEIAYVGNKADYLSNYNNNFGSINQIPLGGLFKKYGVWERTYTDQQVADARPMQNYQSVKIINHQMYSNYNSLQVSWNKQTGRLTVLMNYTFSKNLGIRGENGAAVGDSTLLRNNYGTLPNWRPHIFNAAYVYEVPDLAKSNPVLKGLANGWQISGMTQFQSGSNLQAAVSSNFGFSASIPANTSFLGTQITDANGYAPGTSETVGMSNQNWLGSPDITIMPKVTCDPRKGLGDHQYINGSCFAVPSTPGTNGDYIFPTLIGPSFFNSDLTLQKTFAFGETRKLMFRLSGYNFLNHAVDTFVTGDAGLQLRFDASGRMSNPDFGYTRFKTGHRIVQIMAKFVF